MADRDGTFGAQRVLLAVDDKFGKYSSDAYGEITADAVKKKDAALVFLPASIQGRDVAAHVSGRLDAGLASDCCGLSYEGGKLTAIRSVYSGQAIATVEIDSTPVVATLRKNNFPAEETGGSPEVEKISTDLSPKAVSKDVIKSESKSLDVTEADIIVAGGRGLKDAKNFELIHNLTNALGAAVGASRAVVDDGWIGHDNQVGQTGKVVSPTLYIACGISGAIQHLAGMTTSKCIVAINKDAEAPIFKISDYGIVADLFDVLPSLTEEVKKLKSE